MIASGKEVKPKSWKIEGKKLPSKSARVKRSHPHTHTHERLKQQSSPRERKESKSQATNNTSSKQARTIGENKKALQQESLCVRERARDRLPVSASDCVCVLAQRITRRKGIREERSSERVKHEKRRKSGKNWKTHLTASRICNSYTAHSLTHTRSLSRS